MNMIFDVHHYQYMSSAIEEAKCAQSQDEVPVGAVIVRNNDILVRAHNMVERGKQVTQHAEMICIQHSSNKLQTKYLHDCILYVTLEPCPMCLHALYLAQIKTIYFGAYSAGFATSNNYIICNYPNMEIYGGIEEQQCNKLLTNFFENKRL